MVKDSITISIHGFGISVNLECDSVEKLDKLQNRVKNILEYFGEMMKTNELIKQEKEILEREFVETTKSEGGSDGK